VRLIFGFKKLAWNPSSCPASAQARRSGADRRLPQDAVSCRSARDMYCDTALICDVLEHMRPTPALYPRWHKGWRVCWPSGPTKNCSGPPWPTTFRPKARPRCLAARPDAPPNSGARGQGVCRRPRQDALRHAPHAIARRRRRLQELPAPPGQHAGHASPTCLGDAPCVADFAAYHPLWFTRTQTPVMAVSWRPRPQCWPGWTAWPPSARARQASFHAADAISICKAATRVGGILEDKTFQDEHGIALGPVSASRPRVLARSRPRASWSPPLACTTPCAATDDRAGTVHVHFPRIGYVMKKAQA
jgi:glutathione S-transferase